MTPFCLLQLENLPQLRSYLGLLNYYGKFIPKLATIAHPLYRLLKNDVEWNWDSDCELAFKETKESLTSADVLVHFDSKLPISLAGDASAYGIGSVISHKFPDGTEKPIAFASKSLSAAEKNYSQLEREAASLVLASRNFTSATSSKKGIPTLTAARLQRFSLLLSAYNYDIQFKPTAAHGNADGLSRLPLSVVTEEKPTDDVTVFKPAQIGSCPM